MLAFILLALIACEPEPGKPGDPPGDSPADTGEPGDSDGHTGEPGDSDDDSDSPPDSDAPDSGFQCTDTGDAPDTGAPDDPTWTSCADAPVSTGASWAGWQGPRTLDNTGDTLNASQVVDLDADGLLDLVACGTALSWNRNTGPGWLEDWSGAWEGLALDEGCGALQAADVDGDGDPDIIVGGAATGLVQWYENVGGDLTGGETITTDPDLRYRPLSAADVDGDGAVDLVGRTDVYWGYGDGTFDPVPSTLEGRGGSATALPLLDGGGTVLIDSYGTWIAHTDRSFEQVNDNLDCRCMGGEPARNGPQATFDANGDGHADVLLGAALCLGDGDGDLRFGEYLTEMSWMEGDKYITTIHDNEGDGTYELVFDDENEVQDRRDGDLHLVRYGPSGVEAVASHTLPARTVHDAGGSLWQDLDGDGEVDLLAWDSTSDEWYLVPRDGVGGFSSGWSRWVNDGAIVETTAADLDGDGYQDLVAIDDAKLLALRNECGRSFALHAMVSTTEPSGHYLTFASPGLQLDADAGEEVVVAGVYGRYLLQLDGDEITLTDLAADALSYQDYQSWHQVADLDGDGDDEVVQQDMDLYLDDDDLARVLGLTTYGDLSGVWTLTGADLSSELLGLTTGDLTGDGQADLVLLDETGARIWTWSDTELDLVEAVSTELSWLTGYALPDLRRGITAADADGDGDEDVWVALPDAGVVRVLLNDGAGALSVGDDLDAPDDMVDSWGLALRDVGDGGLAAWAWDGLGGFRAWRLEGDTFVEVDDLVSAPDSDPIARDIDGDGLLDFTAAENNRAEIVWGTAD